MNYCLAFECRRGQGNVPGEGRTVDRSLRGWLEPRVVLCRGLCVLFFEVFS